MPIIRRKGWEIPESQVTPEAIFLNRRQLMGVAAGAAVLITAGPSWAMENDPSASLYPAKTNPKYADAGRPVTDQNDNKNFNNYYEFGTRSGSRRPPRRCPSGPGPSSSMARSKNRKPLASTICSSW